MPRFYLHIFNSLGLAPDEEGSEHASADEARAAALDGIRSLLAEEVRSGRLDLRGRIEIGDERANIVTVVHFKEAIQLQMDDGGS